MRASEQDIQRFREWLIRRVRSSVWWRFGNDLERAKEWGPKLGLDPEILMAAHAMKEQEDAELPFRKLAGQRKNDRDNPQLVVHFHPEIWEVWMNRCDHLHLKSTTLLRGVINAYLLGDWEPHQVGKSWVYNNRTYLMGRADHKGNPCVERCLVSRGAREALRVRAQRQRCSMQGLLRGIVLEHIEDRVTPVLVEPKRMYEDPWAYLDGRAQ